ncbi:MAG: Holliday junction branch migration protein RuvA [Paenibacillus macerans]|uniref:Holliday junction branch migration complex subunit RuvA n=1 Tax=Paenibacillus macerans TaxID=44252 RepID=A0A090ZM45_PAEMA|nr:Holliday junction branch migration protein RuvA [Paenibacillus macerans]KFN11330.1 Holliday junction DNA helicase RuvA [Paenibacillus macerans]MBS5911953.1 Holliday junction branch migration protein RuvA [Paenibacillus macerans]MCY7558887.1 Holliday junction branch migration protein RuvA [Paenibacillus macerans]MDU5946483.1 Holliday junction branch migration protein RuvA [Paenibacillus macerans]MDU7472885.1 Holliday junction branch migration protein RuvA [Paenibacillus macerans]
MIDFLRGQVAHLETEYVVLDVQGVGYQVFCPNPYAFAAKGQETVTIYTHHHVREDAILLFGFPTREEQRLFRKLIEVSGIGPRVALGILSGGSPDHVVAAIHQENIGFLTKLPGIGKKTAQRMILDLKDKLEGMGGPSLFDDPSEALPAAESAYPGWPEAREGLKALGYTDAELDKVWHRMKEDVAPDEAVDSVMKKALKLLYAG